MGYVKLSFSHVEFISQSSKTQMPIPRESPAKIIKRRVYLVIILLGLPGIYTAWSANRIEQPFMANAYICLVWVSCLP